MNIFVLFLVGILGVSAVVPNLDNTDEVFCNPGGTASMFISFEPNSWNIWYLKPIYSSKVSVSDYDGELEPKLPSEEISGTQLFFVKCSESAEDGDIAYLQFIQKQPWKVGFNDYKVVKLTVTEGFLIQ